MYHNYSYSSPGRGGRAPLASLKDDGLDDDDLDDPTQCICYNWGVHATCLYLLITGLTCAVIMLVAFGIEVVIPYRNALHYMKNTCHVKQSTYTGLEPCSCGKNCTAQYNCLIVTGYHELTNVSQEGIPVTKKIFTTIYDSEHDLRAKKCSYRPPVCSDKETYNEVSRYKHRYGGQGMIHICYFHPDDPTLVFREPSVTKEKVLHSMLWPSVMIVLFTLGLFFMYKGTDFTIWVFSCGMLDREESKCGHQAIL